MISDNDIDQLFEELEQVMDGTNDPLVGLCLVVQFEGYAHVLGIGSREHMKNITECVGKGGEIVNKKEIN